MDEEARNMDGLTQSAQLRAGVAVLGATMAAAVALLGLGANVQLRALLFVPFFAGIYTVAAGLSGNCVLSAYRSQRLTFEGAEPMADRGDVHANRRRGLWQLAKVVALSIAATTLLLLAAH